ncbi:hypothetical protein F2P81_005222 [Scophthalmus maximus]|uniref:Uncharacterized protein n=1 Tax=Scophthalmus maximus TaxID=52904 RepID=A0A6A4TD03_SCOMX|nr:hypothetical protein F2P81_005222 [Scophthalmus maximus]
MAAAAAAAAGPAREVQTSKFERACEKRQRERRVPSWPFAFAAFSPDHVNTPPSVSAGDIQVTSSHFMSTGSETDERIPPPVCLQFSSKNCSSYREESSEGTFLTLTSFFHPDIREDSFLPSLLSVT